MCGGSGSSSTTPSTSARAPSAATSARSAVSAIAAGSVRSAQSSPMRRHDRATWPAYSAAVGSSPAATRTSCAARPRSAVMRAASAVSCARRSSASPRPSRIVALIRSSPALAATKCPTAYYTRWRVRGVWLAPRLRACFVASSVGRWATLLSMSTPSPSNLSDAQWNGIHRFLPPRSPHGSLRRHFLRSIFDALFYLVRTGCPWR